MSKAIFLVNPELRADQVEVTATSELSGRGGGPIPFADNSNLLNLTTIGDPGDDDAHDVEILGTQQRPAYSPLTSLAVRQYTAPTTFATLATLAVGSAALTALVSADDRLWDVVADSGTLSVYVWNGTAWTLKASLAGLTDASGGIDACSIKENVYIAVGNNTDSVVELYRFSTRTLTIGVLSETFASTAGDLEALAFATNGATCVLLTTLTGHDVQPYFGALGSSLDEADDTINDLFSSTWSTSDDVRAAALKWSPSLGYVAAFRAGTSSPASLRLAVSPSGDGWTEFKSLAGAVVQPTAATPWGDALCCAIALENRRVFVWRATAAVQDDPPTDVKLQWFDGAATWSSDVDADGSVAVDAGTQLSAANWRGRMHFGWRNASAQATVRKCNELTTSNTGIFREIVPGQQNFVAGIEDDTKTALFFVASGSITAGDKFRIKATEYDYRVEHLLDDFMAQVWRGAHDEEQVIQFDAGSGRAFLVDAVQVFYSHLPSITVQISDDPGFGTPSTDQDILATVQTATVTGADRNRVLFADGTFKARQYAAGGPSKFWVQLSTGVLRILDNTHNALIVDGSATGASLAPVTIFRDSMSYVFATEQTAGRYLRLITPTLELPDGYYEISRVLFGLRLSLPRNFSSGFQRDHAEIEATTQLKSGARFPTKLNERQRVSFTLPFQVVELEEHLRSIEGLYALGRGSTQLVGFCPFPTPFPGGAPDGNQPDIYIGRIVEPLSVTHINQKFYSVGGLRFESEVE